ncbi:NMDA receptor synaptonuclear signaling and neuronal migration factor isoform X3 [Paramisgurnus dabryanus]|uniref:NMDA receptor synaptonuclear signaling and neuronal migration factor isoform X3 n=1 Tax=Paramisgurnus dabryanus TaxID=90735 RepID=UPI0031F338BE
MGTAVSKRKNLRNDAISSVAAKVRAARAFGDYLHTHPENRNGSDHLLSDTLVGHDSDCPESLCTQNNNHHSYTLQGSTLCAKPSLINPALGLLEPPTPTVTSKSRLSLERSFSAEEDQQKCLECSLQPARVYTITGESGMLGTSRGSKENLELDVLKDALEACDAQALTQTSTSSNSSSPTQYHRRHGGGGTSGNQHRGNHHHGNHHYISSSGDRSGATNHNQELASAAAASHHHHGATHHHHHLSQPLQSSVSAHNIRGWGEGKDCGLACEGCPGTPSRSQGSLDLESSTREADDNSWLPKENMFSFQTATTTMQANFRKHLRMVGSRRMKAQSGDLQTTCCTPDEGGCEDMDWEEEREMERLACEGDDFIPPKIMLISSKVPKAEYVPNIIRRGDPSIIPILYDHEHATFDDILEEIEKRLTAYRKGSKIWRMLIFCQGGPGHLYLLKNKVATFAKVEKEEDMSQFWKRLSRFMSKVNPEPNLIHIMGCYVLGNPNGEKLFQKLKNLMRPYSVTFESPLELSAQGKEMIEMYFDFRLFRLWKTRQHSKLLDYEDLL